MDRWINISAEHANSLYFSSILTSALFMYFFVRKKFKFMLYLAVSFFLFSQTLDINMAYYIKVLLLIVALMSCFVFNYRELSKIEKDFGTKDAVFVFDNIDKFIIFVFLLTLLLTKFL